MDFKAIEEFQRAFWTHYNTIYDRVLLTGKRFPVGKVEGIMYSEIWDKLTVLTKNIAYQLSKDKDVAPTLLGYVQSFLNEVYRTDHVNSMSEPFCELGNRIPIHPAINKLQELISTLCETHKVDCDVYSPISDESLSGLSSPDIKYEEEKENIAANLFTNSKSREFVDKAIQNFHLVNENGECIAQKGRIRGFVQAMRENMILNNNKGIVKQVIDFQKYINHPNPTRIPFQSNMCYEMKDEINAYIDRQRKKGEIE